MVKTSACERCGYRPRTTDAFEVLVEGRLDDSEVLEHTVVHVICYGCGHEWVE